MSIPTDETAVTAAEMTNKKKSKQRYCKSFR